MSRPERTPTRAPPPSSRWPIVRNLLLLLVVLGGISMAARRGRKEEAPPEPVEAPPEPEATPAPPLFDQPLPVALQQTPAGLASLSAQSCAACHVAAHDGWARSAHARAWRDPGFQRSLASAGESTACRACHLPLVNQHPSLAVGYVEADLARPKLQPNPAWDPTLMSEGVTCAACHVRGDTVLGLHPSPGAPHPVSVSTELSSPTMCATCHQLTWPEADKPFYDTFGEWQASAYAAAGVRCQDCHMPPTAGVATATRFAAQADHAGVAEPRRALTVLVKTSSIEIHRGEAFRVDLRLLNTGAGHHFPTGSPFKAYRIVVELLDASGAPLDKPFVEDIRREVEAAPPWATVADNRIPAGGELALQHEFTVDQRKKAGQAELVVSLRRVVGDQADGEVDSDVLQTIPIPLH